MHWAGVGMPAAGEVDSEQIWHVLDGQVEISGTPLAAGDTVVLPVGDLRRVCAVSDARMLVCGRGDASCASTARTRRAASRRGWPD
ncbi:MAG: hypothetical protein ACXVFL_02240 [Solirubrobacteraceae bacterium]